MSGILAIDTASPVAIALAFLDESAELRELRIDGAQTHSQRLVAGIDELTGGGRGSIAAIGVTTGPGSYAGLRVGIATAEALAMGLGVPLFGCDTFLLVAGASGLDNVVTVHPAGRGEGAFQVFRDGKADGAPSIGELPPLGLPVAGEGAGGIAGGVEVAPAERAKALAWLTLGGLASGERPQGIEAFYLREPNITRPKRTHLAPAGR